jgi:hypothetical protein
MPAPVIPRPADHAFVLQLQARRGRPEVCRAGRVEHLASGQATTFTTTTELWNFIDTVLTELTREVQEEDA